jgi:hypothetical protein
MSPTSFGIMEHKNDNINVNSHHQFGFGWIELWWHKIISILNIMKWIHKIHHTSILKGPQNSVYHEAQVGWLGGDGELVWVPTKQGATFHNSHGDHGIHEGMTSFWVFHYHVHVKEKSYYCICIRTL